MLRRSFIKFLAGAITLPLTPFPNAKKKLQDKINNSALIKRLLKEKKDFTITCDGDGFNIIRRKRLDRNLLEEVDKAFRVDNNLPSNESSRSRWKPKSEIGKKVNMYDYGSDSWWGCRAENIEKLNQKFIDE